MPRVIYSWRTGRRTERIDRIPMQVTGWPRWRWWYKNDDDDACWWLWFDYDNARQRVRVCKFILFDAHLLCMTAIAGKIVSQSYRSTIPANCNLWGQRIGCWLAHAGLRSHRLGGNYKRNKTKLTTLISRVFVLFCWSSCRCVIMGYTCYSITELSGFRTQSKDSERYHLPRIECEFEYAVVQLRLTRGDPFHNTLQCTQPEMTTTMSILMMAHPWTTLLLSSDRSRCDYRKKSYCFVAASKLLVGITKIT